jgi:hypothetical protein
VGIPPEQVDFCPTCSMGDHINTDFVHLAHRDVTLVAITLAPLARIEPFKVRMGWQFTFVSSHGTDFNRDFGVLASQQEVTQGKVYYNYEHQDWTEYPSVEKHGLKPCAAPRPGRMRAVDRESHPGASSDTFCCPINIYLDLAHAPCEPFDQEVRQTATESADRAGLVTGGTRGIGADIVRRLAGEGARVALTCVISADRALVQSPQFREKSCPHG